MVRNPGVLFSAAVMVVAIGTAHAADAGMVDAAKKEGSVVWYTTAIIDQIVRPTVDAFEKRYGVKVDYVRSQEIPLRVINEAKAGRVMADLVDGTATTPALRREGLIAQWTPNIKVPARYVDAEGYWMATIEYVLTAGYNTDLVPEAIKPTSWEDLLDPRWKGKMVWNIVASSSSGQGFTGLVLTELGEQKGRAYLARLAKQDVTGIAVSARQILDLVIAGEYPIALEIFNNHATVSRAQGATVNWIRMNPAMAVMNVMSLTKDAPHPNAGKLLFEFIVSPEGQKINRDAGQLPVSPDLEPIDPSLRPGPDTFRAHYFTPEKLEASIPEWTRVYNEYFR